jgi:hypothetical protein
MSTSPGGAHSLTGVWQGLYTYPGNGDPVPFVATLIQTGSAIGGTTHETAAVNDATRKTLYALLSGSRAGASVAFVKNYDGTAGWSHRVDYDGALNGDATEIEGRWNINGILAGKFMMIREAGEEIAVRRGVFERV